MNDPSTVSILVCDDTDAKRYVISSWLRRAGYQVVEAATGGEALDLVAGGSLDLAVLDVHLPDMNGFEVCRAIKQGPRTAAMPVLHISAIAVDPEQRSAGLDYGADAYLVDPIEPLELLSTVRALLRSSGARRSAERLATRLGRLSTANLRINVAVNLTRLVGAAAEGTARVLESESVAMLVGDDGRSLAARTGADGVTTTWSIPADAVATLVTEAKGATLVEASHEPWTTLLPEAGQGTWSVMPVREGHEVVGLVGAPGTPESEADDRLLLRQLAQSVSVAHSNLRVFAEEHRIALTLQRSLLPATLPPLPGLEVAARYKASGEQAEIGGDFFDAFQTDDGSSVVVIGDVQGHSLAAAVLMAELRYSLRAYAHDGYSPPEVMQRINAVLLRSHPEMTATVCMLVFPPDRRSVTVMNAGHLPPLVVKEGVAEYLEPGGPLLGVDVPPGEPETIALLPGDRIVLMTDGLVERRDESISTALERLARDLLAGVGTAEELCDELMARWGAGEDDVALVLLDVVEQHEDADRAGDLTSSV